MMNERNAKRARQRDTTESITRYGAGGGGPGASSTKLVLAGCHLEVKPESSHLFLDQPVEVEVRLLNDEDVVQPTTVDINVTITNQDGKAIANKFELTPQGPALLDGMSTFKLVLWNGSVRAGSRIRVHVEALSGTGTAVKADSDAVMVCRSALAVVTQPPDNWYKDEGGKNNCIEIVAQVREKASGMAQPGVPLMLALLYESGTEVHSQEILQVQADTQLVTNEAGRATLKFKITEVSQRHQSQKFRIKISPDVRASPAVSDVAPVLTIPVSVLSKRKNRKIKEQIKAQGGHSPPYAQSPSIPPHSMYPERIVNLMRGSNGQPQAPSQAQSQAAVDVVGTTGMSWHSQSSIGRTQPPRMPQHPQHPSPQPPPASSPVGGETTLRVPKVPGEKGALQQIFNWTDAVLQLLQMELQWEHIGYERESDGSAAYDRPLFRCPVCRVCKGNHSRTQHAADCRLYNLLGEYENRTQGSLVAAVKELQRASSNSSGGGDDGPNKPGREHMPSRDGASAIPSLPGISSRVDGMMHDCEPVFRRSELPFRVLSGVPPSRPDYPRRDTSGKLLQGDFSGVLGPSSSAEGFQRDVMHEGLVPTRSLAPYLPARRKLTPAEEEAFYIMLPAADEGVANGQAAGPAGKLTVYSNDGKMLGFYEEVWNSEGTLLPFVGVDEGVSEGSKVAFESRLATALTEERRNVSSGRGNPGSGAMEADDRGGAAAGKGRKDAPDSLGLGNPPTRSGAGAGVKKEPIGSEEGLSRGRSAEAAGAWVVFKRRHFESYHDMKDRAVMTLWQKRDESRPRGF